MVLINFRFAFLAAIILSLSLWLVWSATLAQPEAIRWNGWSYSDWLINYQAGFIRRGLSGQIIAELSGQGLAAPVTNLVVFSLYALFAVTFFALAWIGSPKRDATLLLALLVPGGVFAMARDQQFFHRKEILFIIALQLASVLYILILSAKNNEKKKVLVVLFVSFLFAAGTVLPLIHESFVFLGAPGLLILLTALIQNSPENQHLRGVRIAFVILVILGFVVAALFKGDADHALKIWNSLSESDRLRLSPDAPWRPFGAIMAIGYTLLHGVAGIAVILSGNFWLWVFIAVSVFLIVGLITACIEPEEPTRAAALFSFLLLLILASLPMYLIGEDWGRWITAVSISYLSLMYALRSGPQPSIAPGILDPMVRWSTPIMAKAVQHRTALLWLAILYSLTFSYPECCLGVGKKVNPLSAAHKAAQNIYRSLAPGASWVGRPSR